MKKMLSLICIVLISITTSYAQSNYDLELAEKLPVRQSITKKGCRLPQRRKLLFQ